jgi:hypothetical protein
VDNQVLYNRLHLLKRLVKFQLVLQVLGEQQLQLEQQQG